MVGVICTACGTDITEESRMKCSGCLLVYYCNVECQHSHWRAHRPHCKKNLPGSKNARKYIDAVLDMLKDNIVYCTAQHVMNREHAETGAAYVILVSIDVDVFGNVLKPEPDNMGFCTTITVADFVRMHQEGAIDVGMGQVVRVAPGFPVPPEIEANAAQGHATLIINFTHADGGTSQQLIRHMHM